MAMQSESSFREKIRGTDRSKKKKFCFYKSEKGQFEYSILPEEKMQKREERGLLMIQSAREQLVLKMEEYLEE